MQHSRGCAETVLTARPPTRPKRRTNWAFSRPLMFEEMHLQLMLISLSASLLYWPILHYKEERSAVTAWYQMPASMRCPLIPCALTLRTNDIKNPPIAPASWIAHYSRVFCRCRWLHCAACVGALMCLLLWGYAIAQRAAWSHWT